MSRFQNPFDSVDNMQNDQHPQYGFESAQQPHRKMTVYQPYRDPSRAVYGAWSQSPSQDSMDCSTESSFDTLCLSDIDDERAQAGPKPSMLRKMLKRRSSSVEDVRTAKRHKAEPSKHERGFRQRLKQRARDIAGIVAANANERQQYENQLKLAYEQQIEEYRRQHPEERPEYQQAYLVEKQKTIFPGTAYEALQGARHYQALVEEHNAEVRQKAGLQADYQNRCRMSLALGSHLPTPPISGQGPALELDQNERQQARQEAYEQNGRMPEDGFKGLSKAQKLVMGISKILDPLKKTKAVENDDMDFGMFDAAPADSMEVCNICREPTQTYLINGACRFCHDKQRRR